MKNTTSKIILSLVFIGFLITSCNTVNKVKKSNQFAEKKELDSVKEVISKQRELISKKANSSSLSEVSRKLDKYTEKTKEDSKEDVKTTISIVAEDGKEKSATVGGLTAKSNGSNITIESTSSKSTSKETESKIKSLIADKKIQESINEDLIKNNESQDKEIYSLNSKIERLEKELSKDKNKSGLTFTTVLIGLGVLLVLGVGYYILRRFSF